MQARWKILAVLVPALFALAACGGAEEAGGPSVAEIMAPGPLPDQVLGDPNAPVTVVEYASMTCPHCQAFHTTVYHAFVERYVDTGQVRFIFREFPLDNLAKAGALLARCTPGENGYFTMVDLLFETQMTWARAPQPTDALFAVAQQAGFTRESFEACLTNQELEAGIDWSYNRGAELGVTGTPTFFINGTKHSGEISLEELGRLVEAAR